MKKPSLFILVPVMVLAFSFGNSAHALPFSDSLPSAVHFRDVKETFNSKYMFVLRNCIIWYKNKKESGAEWKRLSLHKNISCPKEIHVDSELLIALDSANRIFTLFGALCDDTGEFKWFEHWGAPFRLASGMAVPADNNGIAFSYLSPLEDAYYRTANGNKYDVGKGVSNLFFLRQKGQHIIYLDPWLPNDFSYQVGSPHRGRFQAIAISASGSTLFIISKYGDMYTRTYDFDMVGADNFFFHYSYHTKEYNVNDTLDILSRKIPRPLPLAGWKQQPKIQGAITDRITIFKAGKGAVRRTLRVEGKDSLGRTGYFFKDISDVSWSFCPTGLPLRGNVLENCKEDKSAMTLGPDESSAYRCSGENISWEVPDFHPYCSPATLRISWNSGPVLELPFHYHETIRQKKREEGLTSDPLLLRGAIELPPSVMKNLNQQQMDFVQKYFKEDDFTDIEIKVTVSEMKVKAQKRFSWVLRK